MKESELKEERNNAKAAVFENFKIGSRIKNFDLSKFNITHKTFKSYRKELKTVLKTMDFYG
jgi:hypothetical protein